MKVKEVDVIVVENILSFSMSGLILPILTISSGFVSARAALSLQIISIDNSGLTFHSGYGRILG